MDTKTNFSEKLKELRRKKGFTQRQLADKLDISFQAISTYEQGKSVPQSDVLAQIAQKLGVSADYLLGLTDEETTDTEIRAVAKYLGLEVSTIQLLLDYNNKHDGIEYSKTQVIEKMLKDHDFLVFIDRCCASINFLQGSFPLTPAEEDLCYTDAITHVLQATQKNFFNIDVETAKFNNIENDMLIYKKPEKII